MDAGGSIESLTDVTIDDDKLRHSSRTLGDHGLKRTGFRGSRCGPVMNAAGAVQTGLILSIYFSRFGDAALSTVKYFSIWDMEKSRILSKGLMIFCKWTGVTT
jgi:hypothetical protein